MIRVTCDSSGSERVTHLVSSASFEFEVLDGYANSDERYFCEQSLREMTFLDDWLRIILN